MIPNGYTWSGNRWVCKFCFGKGCLSCPPLPPPPVLKEQPDKPLFSISTDALNDQTSDAFRVFKATMHRDVIVREFSPGGGGHEAVRQILERERAAIAAERGTDLGGYREDRCYYCDAHRGDEHQTQCGSPFR